MEITRWAGVSFPLFIGKTLEAAPAFQGQINSSSTNHYTGNTLPFFTFASLFFCCCRSLHPSKLPLDSPRCSLVEESTRNAYGVQPVAWRGRRVFTRTHWGLSTGGAAVDGVAIPSSMLGAPVGGTRFLPDSRSSDLYRNKGTTVALQSMLCLLPQTTRVQTTRVCGFTVIDAQEIKKNKTPFDSWIRLQSHALCDALAARYLRRTRPRAADKRGWGGHIYLSWKRFFLNESTSSRKKSI